MVKIFIESDKFSHIAGVTLHATNTIDWRANHMYTLYCWITVHDYYGNEIIDHVTQAVMNLVFFILVGP